MDVLWPEALHLHKMIHCLYAHSPDKGSRAVASEVLVAGPKKNKRSSCNEKQRERGTGVGRYFLVSSWIAAILLSLSRDSEFCGGLLICTV